MVPWSKAAVCQVAKKTQEEKEKSGHREACSPIRVVPPHMPENAKSVLDHYGVWPVGVWRPNIGSMFNESHAYSKQVPDIQVSYANHLVNMLYGWRTQLLCWWVAGGCRHKVSMCSSIMSTTRMCLSQFRWNLMLVWGWFRQKVQQQVCYNNQHKKQWLPRGGQDTAGALH